MPHQWTIAFLLTAGASSSDPAVELERGTDATCRVHGPSRLVSGGDSGTSDYVPHYTGECRNGVAHGQGRLEWRMRWTPGRTRAVWEGRFIDGVFVGNQPVDHVTALAGGHGAAREFCDVLLVASGRYASVLANVMQA